MKTVKKKKAGLFKKARRVLVLVGIFTALKGAGKLVDYLHTAANNGDSTGNYEE